MKDYQLGRVKVTLIPFGVYTAQNKVFGKNQALDAQPDGHLGFVAHITVAHNNGTVSLMTDIDASDKMIEIERYLLDKRGCELALITMRADYGYNLSGYVSSLLRTQYQPCPEERFKIDQLIAAQSNPKIAAELQAWADKWIA